MIARISLRVSSSATSRSNCDSLVVRDRQRHWNGKQMAVGQTHFLDDAPVICGAHEAVERAESAGGEQFQIANRAL